MTDTPHTLAPDDARLDRLRTPPTSVADALERVVRIDAITGWLSDVRDQVRDGYLGPKADQVEQDLGGAFNVPVAGLGRVYRTDPQPKPIVTDQAEFAHWYLTDVAGEDPSRDPDEPLVRFDADVVRRHTAEADPADLLGFLHTLAQPADDCDVTYAAAHTLAESIRVAEEWVLPAGLLDDLLAAKVDAAPSGRARVELHRRADDSWAAIDTASGQPVPGVTVKAPAKAVLTVKPDPAARKRIRAELDELLGTPALHD